MKQIGFREKFILPDYRNIKHIEWGTVEIDSKLCNGCGQCVRICPSRSLVMERKKAASRPDEGFVVIDPGINQCMSCGDCIAICPQNAISIKSSYTWSRYFKTINRGPLTGPRLFSES